VRGIADADPADVELLASHLRPGMSVALADGAGAPRRLAAALPEAARRVGGGIRLFTGWWLTKPLEHDSQAFGDVVTFMGGYGLAEGVAAGTVRYAPCRLSLVPRLVRSVFRPELLLASARPDGEGLSFCTEVSWMMAAVDAGAKVVAEVNEGLPLASRDATIPAAQIAATLDAAARPAALPRGTTPDELRTIGERVAALIPKGASVQFGPGGVGHAMVEALQYPVKVDSGLLTDAVVDLDRRGLLERVEAATYAVGTDELYSWLDGRRVLVRAETSHDFGRLAKAPLVAVNTALEVDMTGAVNIESVGGRPIAGVGGHPDYALAAALSPSGLSVIAVQATRHGRSTLVRSLSGPVSTARIDVDVVVTERGVADLRGLDDRGRERALIDAWGGEGPDG
jgi:acyl-CoA hydrolase